MNINFFRGLKVIFQGFTGKMGTYHSKLSMDYNTNVVGGVSPGKGGLMHLGKPVFNNVFDAVKFTGANASVIFVPAERCRNAIIEAIYAGIKLVICVTEGIPIRDMLFLKKLVLEKKVFFVGPNSPGIVVPNVCRLGIMPIDIHIPGIVGIISRSGTLTYEAINQTSKNGLGQSMSIGIGGDPIVGTTFVNMLEYFFECDYTKAVLIIGEIGGSLEEDAAEFLKSNYKKPVFAYIAGVTAPIGKRMGHVGAIIRSGNGGAMEKIKLLEQSNVIIIKSIDEIGSTIINFMNKH